MSCEIKEFNVSEHRDQVIWLWREVFGYEADHNEPGLVIDKKIRFGDGLFFVALDDQDVVGTVMAGYDGHRGWIYSLAVSLKYRNRGVGSKLLSHAEKKLHEIGCMKINLQILSENEEVKAFYISNGYHTERRISMGKRLP